MMKRNVEEEIKLAMGKRGWESNIKEMYLAFTSCQKCVLEQQTHA